MFSGDAQGSATTSAADGVPPEGRCRRCNYPLRGLDSGRCPECGQEFDPQNPATMNLGRAVGRVEQFFASPPGIWLNGAAFGATVLSIVSDSGPGGYFGWAMLSAFTWMVLGAIWLIRLLIAAGIWIARRRMERTNHRGSWRWVALPIIALASISFCWIGGPEWLAFQFSRAAMDRLAIEWAKNPAPASQPEWIGVYPVNAVESVPGGVRFSVEGAGFWDIEGFAYFERGVPPVDGCIYKHVGGSWFRWTIRF